MPKTRAGAEVVERAILKAMKYVDKAPWRARTLLSVLMDRHNLDEVLYGCEIGVERGDTSQALLRYLPRLTLTCVDAWEFGLTASVGKPMGEEKHLENKRTTQRRLAEFQGRHRLLHMHSDLAANLLTDEQAVFDFVFVDADHSYEGTKSDLEHYWPLVGPRGLIAGDDYGGRREKHGCPGWGVKRAVDEFAESVDREVHDAPLNVWWIDKCHKKDARP